MQNGHDAVDEDGYKAELYTLLEIQRETEIKLSKLALWRFAPGKVKIHQLAEEGNEIKRKQSAKVRAISTQTLPVIYQFDGSVWIADGVNKTMNHLKLTNDIVQVISKTHTHVYCILL